jgi:hypothetical protein
VPSVLSGHHCTVTHKEQQVFLLRAFIALYRYMPTYREVAGCSQEYMYSPHIFQTVMT